MASRLNWLAQSPTHVYSLPRVLQYVRNSKMAREISLFLKYPGPHHAIQRLEHSFLECVVEYKNGTEAELQTRTPMELRSEYQLKGTAVLADDEIVVQFLPKHAGIHTVRIFADTRELCRPVSFRVSRACEIEGIPSDRPVKPAPAIAAQTLLPPATAYDYTSGRNQPQFQAQYRHSSPMEQQLQARPQSPSMSSQQTSNQPEYGFGYGDTIRGFMSDPSLPTLRQEAGGIQRASFIASQGNNRPSSMVQGDSAYPGDLLSSKPDQSTFDQMYAAKRAGHPVYGTRRGVLSLDHTSAITEDALRTLHKDIDLQVASHLSRAKIKRRCSICSKKVKPAKSVSLGEEDYCEPCFKRNYLLRSAIDHFMIPTVQECSIEVPVNKKGTKFVTARKTIPNVNLRGLEASDVRNAQAEFRKFDMENNGWINKAVLLPIMKACFSSSVRDKEIKALLLSPPLQDVIKTYGLDHRHEVHEIEFLSLLAFVARERQRLRTNTNPNTKFTRSDLEMAYAFRQQFGTRRQAPVNPLYESPTRSTDHADFGKRRSDPKRLSQLFPKSPTDSALEAMSSPTSHYTSQFDRRASLRNTSSQQNPLFPPTVFNPHALTPQHQPKVPPLSSNRNSSGFAELDSSLQPAGLGGLQELPEEDQDEELPTLPPGKDPAIARLTSPLHNKGPAANKQMMEELKLTGGSADGWMLY